MMKGDIGKMAAMGGKGMMPEDMSMEGMGMELEETAKETQKEEHEEHH
ncbi:MAG: hypothetical protein IME96_07955 [Proteobacteria bacterium]|nr:hypothetical protein [Pseudomonadota bacterium]